MEAIHFSNILLRKMIKNYQTFIMNAIQLEKCNEVSFPIGKNQIFNIMTKLG